ncbi:PEP-CTERM sorting domain-containing protein [Myxococcota bacterium]|nr:PEP-CTERM sorting domain-containing protein [Myxococcota bacterium]
MWNRIQWAVYSAMLLISMVAANSNATTFTLRELTDGTTPSFGSGNTLLTFSDFEVVLSGALSTDLDDYVAVVLDDGWRLVGPIGVADGNVGDIALSYEVAVSGSQGIGAAEIFFNGAASGLGSTANVSEVFFDSNGPIGTLFVAATGGGLSQLTDTITFPAPTPILVTALKDIQVITTSPGTVAAISVIDQRFEVVPEPGTLALASSGLIALIVFRQYRARN